MKVTLAKQILKMFHKKFKALIKDKGVIEMKIIKLSKQNHHWQTKIDKIF
mgnify:CR=1 FL=1